MRAWYSIRAYQVDLSQPLLSACVFEGNQNQIGFYHTRNS